MWIILKRKRTVAWFLTSWGKCWNQWLLREIKANQADLGLQSSATARDLEMADPQRAELKGETETDGLTVCSGAVSSPTSPSSWVAQRVFPRPNGTENGRWEPQRLWTGTSEHMERVNCQTEHRAVKMNAYIPNDMIITSLLLLPGLCQTNWWYSWARYG